MNLYDLVSFYFIFCWLSGLLSQGPSYYPHIPWIRGAGYATIQMYILGVLLRHLFRAVSELLSGHNPGIQSPIDLTFSHSIQPAYMEYVIFIWEFGSTQSHVLNSSTCHLCMGCLVTFIIVLVAHK